EQMRVTRRPGTRSRLRLAAGIAALALVLAGCSGDDDGGTSGGGGGDDDLTPVSLQLQWSAQAQFAGYYAAVEQGYYEDEGLDVTIEEGGPDIVPQDVLA